MDDSQTKYHKTPNFLKLKSTWYKKLKVSGFKDIEMNEEELSRYSFRLKDTYDPSVEDYYTKARDFLGEYRFRSKVDRYIWSLHTEGKSTRKISVRLKKQTTLPHLKHTAVHLRIRKLEAEMLGSKS